MQTLGGKDGVGITDTIFQTEFNRGKNTLIINEGIPGNPNLTIINESGHFAAVLRIRKEESKKLKCRVTSEISPAFRKHIVSAPGKDSKQVTGVF